MGKSAAVLVTLIIAGFLKYAERLKSLEVEILQSLNESN